MKPARVEFSRREFSKLTLLIFAFLTGVRAIAKPTDNTGYWQHRIAPNVPLDFKLLEEAFAKEWEAWNDPRQHGGNGILQDLMFSTSRYEDPPGFDPILTDRERKIVATVIQWLGTNVGGGFLSAVNRRAGGNKYPFEDALANRESRK